MAAAARAPRASVGAGAPGSSVPVAVAPTLACVEGGGVAASAQPHGVRCRLAEAGASSWLGLGLGLGIGLGLGLGLGLGVRPNA